MSFDFSPIAAIATATGYGGIGVVRISGKKLGYLIEAVCGIPESKLIPRYATYLSFKNADGSIIDKGLAIYFKAPHSYTGEDVLELQAHGGPVVLKILLGRCLAAGDNIGLRIAAPGEFTQRAFINEKLDLAQAEAVADLIEASTEVAAKLASESLSGEFSKVIYALVGRVTNLRMLVEAILNFPEEEIDFSGQSDLHNQLVIVHSMLDNVFSQATQGALLRDGLNIVLAGQPNVGKSSLLNVLAGSDVAIVTSIAGTTRDKLTETIQLAGVPLNIIDTAGIRDTEDTKNEVEQIGIERTWAAVAMADVILYIQDANYSSSLEDKKIIARFPSSTPIIRIWNKIDQSSHSPSVVVMSDATHIYLSATNHLGIDLLRGELLRAAGWQETGESRYLARKRHLIALKAARNHLEIANQYTSAANSSHNYINGHSLDLFAEELRLAQDELSSITGGLKADDLLGMIFSQFCIGK